MNYRNTFAEVNLNNITYNVENTLLGVFFYDRDSSERPKVRPPMTILQRRAINDVQGCSMPLFIRYSFYRKVEKVIDSLIFLL